ncbi:hypothetical protein [Sterolibacterium denitrificans]|uniref:hypothetical protein n=1 Tax=Sterolibacterium denitrificans TaxID=157592 RepID=UPI0012B6A273|nr:hypothetical protein [Sterolibacterium denitrificans]
MIALPHEKKVADLIPAFSDIKGEIRIGTPNRDCACCRKPFTAARKPRKVVRLYSVAAVVHIPIVIEYRVCGKCFAMHERGGNERNAFLAAIEAYMQGSEARQ